MAKNNQKKEKALRNRENAMKFRKKTSSNRGGFRGPRPAGPGQGGPGAAAPRPAAAPPAQAPAEQQPSE